MTARYLLDTDWVIDHFNGIAPVTRRLEELRPAGLALSVISLAELYEGAHYARDPAVSRRVLSRFVAAVTVVPVDDEVCDIFGRERGKLRQQGRTVGDFDLLIAATVPQTRPHHLHEQPAPLRDGRRRAAHRHCVSCVAATSK